jgi:hypothetical protein
MTWKLLPIGEFKDYHEQWQRINLRGPASPLLDMDFIVPLLKEFGSGKELLACHESAGQLDAMALLSRSRRGVWQTFQPSQAPIGAWVHRSEADWSQLLPALRKNCLGSRLQSASPSKIRY